jgi:hypothetical protein
VGLGGTAKIYAGETSIWAAGARGGGGCGAVERGADRGSGAEARGLVGCPRFAHMGGATKPRAARGRKNQLILPLMLLLILPLMLLLILPLMLLLILPLMLLLILPLMLLLILPLMLLLVLPLMLLLILPLSRLCAEEVWQKQYNTALRTDIAKLIYVRELLVRK